MRLLQVQAAFRHGARTPMEGLGDEPARWDAKAQRTYLSGSERRTLCAVSMIHPGEGAAVDPLAHFHTCRTAEPLDGGGLPGMLTRVGLEQSRALGARLRERYVDPQARTSTSVRNGYLLPRAWSSARHLVHPRSTLVERTVFTAAGVLSGLFPEDAAAGAMEAEVHMNVPKGSNGKEEYMVCNGACCPRLAELFHQGQRLSAAALDAQQRRVVSAIEGAANDAWHVGHPGWKLIAYQDQAACLGAEGLPLPAHVGHSSAAGGQVNTPRLLLTLRHAFHVSE